MRGVAACLAFAVAFAVLASRPLSAGERTIAGTIVRLDAAAGTFAVKDAAGAAWSYKVDPDAGIDLAAFREGDRVTVTIARATPPNMITSADRVRKGDRVEKAGF